MYFEKYKILLTHPTRGQIEAREVVGLGDDGREIGRDKDTLAKQINSSNEALEFYGESAKFLKAIFDDNNIENTVRIDEYRANPTSLSNEMERIFSSELDFKTYDHFDGKVSIQYTTQGLLTTIESQFKEKFSFNKTKSVQGKSISLPTEKNMLLAGREIYKYSEWRIDYPDLVPFDLDYVFKTDLITGSDEACKSVFATESGALSQFANKSNSFYYFATYEQKLHLTLDLNFRWDGAELNIYLLRIKRDDSLNAGSDTIENILLKKYTNGTNITVDETIEYTVDPLKYDEGLILYWNNFDTNFFGEIDAKIVIGEFSLFDDTTNKVMRAFDVGDGLSLITTGKTGVFKSDYLNTGPGKDLVMATGKMIRNFPKTIDGESVPYAYITTSWKEYLEHFLAADNLTWGIETVGNKEYLRVEPVEWFLDRNIGYQLPNKVEVRTTPANDFIYSSVTLGFADVLPYEEVTGLDETNASSTWTLPVTKSDESYEFLSPYRMDSNGAELARRRQYISNPTRDTPFDKKIFVFDAYIPSGSTYHVRNSSLDFISVTGLITPDSSYNLRYTPAQLLKKHSNFFLGGIRKIEGPVRFASGEGNTKLQTISTGTPVTVNESQDWDRIDLKRPLFNGEIYEFTHIVTSDILKAIQTNFYQLWEFKSVEGKTYRGYLYNVKIREGVWQILGYR